jgi:hypothetical protein
MALAPHEMPDKGARAAQTFFSSSDAELMQ